MPGTRVVEEKERWEESDKREKERKRQTTDRDRGRKREKGGGQDLLFKGDVANVHRRSP